NLGTWRVEAAENEDWEDVAEYKDGSGRCFIYVGDIGDNKLERAEHAIYRIKEPRVAADTAGTTQKNPLSTEAAERLTFRYPGRNFNAETLLVQPGTGNIYVLTKKLDGPSDVFRINGEFGSTSTVTAEKVSGISVPAVPNGYLTG